ncbi:MAG: prolyl oligopeptidase family serine peptidase [Clostridia bacterium]|nr:prolyl oligopeptidase family serine peptidase [Clostridia bacterium]
MEISHRFKIPEENEKAAAFWAENMQARVFVSSQGLELPYRLYIPPEPKPGMPFQLHLHGGGLRGNDNLLQLQGDHRQTQMLTSYQKKEAFFFAIPQCPMGFMWSPGTKYNELWKSYLHYTPEESTVVRALYELTLALTEEFGLDERQRYVSGCSMGGSGAYDLLVRYPGLFKGAVIGCANADASITARLKDNPIYLMHGSEDQAIYVENARLMARYLREAGAPEFEYVEFPGRGHNFMEPDCADDELEAAMDWIRSKVKAKLS